MQWTKGKIALAGVGGLFVLGAIGNAVDPPKDDAASAGGGSSAALSAVSEASAPAEPEATPVPALELEPLSDRTVYRDQVTLTGSLRAVDGGTIGGARVTVKGKTAPVSSDGRWRKTVTVHAGGNSISVRAEKPGYDTAESELTLTRERSKAERIALAQKRAAQDAARKQSYMAGAKLIPYNQLDKNADAHSGERVKFTGQIFQIQEDYGSTVILLSVTDEGYGFWTDQVWVDYDGTIKGAEDDIITVYGTIEGSKSYETQIGGETYVPQMTAKYVVE